MILVGETEWIDSQEQRGIVDQKLIASDVDETLLAQRPYFEVPNDGDISYKDYTYQSPAVSVDVDWAGAVLHGNMYNKIS